MNVWIDTESGTWFWNKPVPMNTETWTDGDWQIFDNIMSDSQRSDYAIEVSDGSPFEAQPTPTAWYAENEVE